MNRLSILAGYLRRLSFSQAVWFFPAAFTLHVLEEIGSFSEWAQRHASPEYTFHDYVTIHAVGILSAIASAFFLTRYRNRSLTLIFFAFMFMPAVFWNMFFHAGASVLFHEYCPGVITALTIYPPLFIFLSMKALGEKLLATAGFILALAVGGMFHFLEVGHNIFRAW